MKSRNCKIITAIINLITLTLCAGVLTSSANTYAESSSANASVTVANTITLTLTGGDLVINNLTPGNSADSNVITASVTSNSPYGFHLAATTGASTGTDSLVNTADSNFTFTNLSTNKATLANFSDNTWGYTYSTDNGTTWVSGDYATTATAGYNGLPLDNNDSGATSTTLFNSDSYLGSKSVQFKIGAKSATTQAAGTYTNTINFYAVAHRGPVDFDMAYADAGKTRTDGHYVMQDITTDICSAVDDLETGTLVDIRDHKTYTVAKIQGACWMTQNLRITGTVNTQYSNFSTYGNVDVCEGDLTSGNSYDEPRCYDSENTSNGVWYNYAAASAKTILTDSNTNEATEDICPAGWHLPNYDTAKPAGSINSLAGISLVGVTAFQPVTGGYYGGGSISYPGSGYWWSSTANNGSNRYTLYYFGSSLLTNSHSRNYGMYIRCVR